MLRVPAISSVPALTVATAALAVCATASASPIVWVQAGHEGPREPGYRAQTGDGSGPFGSEITFNQKVAAAVEADLEAAGVDARHTPGRVTPWGARGQVFISIHHDSPGGHAAVGYAVSNPTRGENFYRGEGGSDASPTPYSDSAPHRAATKVTPIVERRSRALARAVSARLGAVHTAENGANSTFTGVEARNGNVRMQYFYGYYRTRAGSRVLVECGAAGADDAFLTKTSLIGKAISRGIIDHLRATGALT